MRELTVAETARIFGGDNPGMGPYVPPITSETKTKYFEAMDPLLTALGPMGGYIKLEMLKDWDARAADYNLRNGYDRSGTTYQWPSGVWGPVTSNDAGEMGSFMAATYGDSWLDSYSDGSFFDENTMFDETGSGDWDYYAADPNFVSW